MYVSKHDPPTLWSTNDVLFVTAGAGFGQTGDGGCVAEQHGPGTNLKAKQRGMRKTEKNNVHQRLKPRTCSSGVMSHRQIWPSWQPVMMVLKSSITSKLLMQWVGAVRLHSTMGRTRLFPDMVAAYLRGQAENSKCFWCLEGWSEASRCPMGWVTLNPELRRPQHTHWDAPQTEDHLFFCLSLLTCRKQNTGSASHILTSKYADAFNDVTGSWTAAW